MEDIFWLRCWKIIRRNFPFVALLVSGGHTQLISVTGIGSMNSAGDRSTTRPVKPSTKPLLGLDYPWRPTVENAAQGTEGRFDVPRPMTDRRAGFQFLRSENLRGEHHSQ